MAGLDDRSYFRFIIQFQVLGLPLFQEYLHVFYEFFFCDPIYLRIIPNKVSSVTPCNIIDLINRISAT